MKEEAGILNGEVSIQFHFAVCLFLKLVYWAMNYIHKFKRFYFFDINLTKYRNNRDFFSVWMKIFSCTRITGQFGTNNDVIYLKI